MFTPAGAGAGNCHPWNSPKHQSSGRTTPPRAPSGDGESALQPYDCHTPPVHGLVDDEQLVLREATLPQLPPTIGCAKDGARRMHHHNNNPNNSDSTTVNNTDTNPGRRRSCSGMPTSADNCHGPVTTACLKQPAKKHMFLKSCEVWHCQGCCSQERDHTILQSELLLRRAYIEPRRLWNYRRPTKPHCIDAQTLAHVYSLLRLPSPSDYPNSPGGTPWCDDRQDGREQHTNYLANNVDCDDNDDDGYLERNMCPIARTSDKCRPQASQMIACEDLEGHQPRLFKHPRRSLPTPKTRGTDFRRSLSQNSSRNSTPPMPPPADRGIRRTQWEERCGVRCNNYDDNQQQHQRWSTNSASKLNDHEPLFQCDTSRKRPVSLEERLLSFTQACKNTYKLSRPLTFCSKEDFNTCPQLASTPMAPCYPLGTQRSHSAPPCRECGRGKSYIPSRHEGFCRTTGSSPPRQYACGCWGSLEADAIPLPLKDQRFQQQQSCYSPQLCNNKSLNASRSSPTTQLSSCAPRGNNGCSNGLYNLGAKKIVDHCSRCKPKLSPRNLEDTVIPSYAATTSSYLRKLKDKTIFHKSKSSDIMKSCPKRPQFRLWKKSQKSDCLGMTLEKTTSCTCPSKPLGCKNLQVGCKRSWN